MNWISLTIVRCSIRKLYAGAGVNSPIAGHSYYGEDHVEPLFTQSQVFPIRRKHASFPARFAITSRFPVVPPHRRNTLAITTLETQAMTACHMAQTE